ncbi:YwmB family TATA-box binding protein [Litchfieldia salsa]|uniref:TATA-box binding n=1 Tax=Litchfieldia salsa TaxID=930152 RepID=A0A1H0WNZ6_9BACI|nr:YwmB family TATA-box binding protein [Litchfieldia salsa]SDP92379.1 TATA-box binding [Litchfieldia salsa]
MKIILTISLSVSILFSFYSQVFGIERYETLNTLQSIAKENQVEVSQWTIYSRGHVEYVKEQEDVEEYFLQIQKEHPEFTWHQEEEKVDHHFVITGTNEKNKEEINEKMTITAYPYNGQYELSKSYQLTGTRWTEDQQQFVTENYGELFSNSEMFYTIRGQLIKKGNLEQKAEHLVRSYGGKIVEGIYEEDFVSLSAFSKEIDTQTMMNGENEMNLQIGLRTSDALNKVDVTIGTPIITTEY